MQTAPQLQRRAGSLIASVCCLPRAELRARRHHRLPAAPTDHVATDHVAMDHAALTEPWAAGRYRPGAETMHASAPATRTLNPSVTGSSVLGLQFDSGVMLAADHLASYGSLARFADVDRIIPVGRHTLVGMGGDISDMQHIESLLETLIITEACHDDGHSLAAPHIHEYLTRVLYARRSKMNPLWNTILVAGVRPPADTAAVSPPDSSPADLVGRGKAWAKSSVFLAYVDLLGTAFSSPSLASGFGAHLAQPILRRELESRGGPEHITAHDAERILRDCLRVLYYRDARSLNKFSIASITRDGIAIKKNQKIEPNWAVAKYVKGYGRDA